MFRILLIILVIILVVVAVILLLRGCIQPKPPVVTPTATLPASTATYTPKPVFTKTYTPTPVFTFTFTPKPTRTIQPTKTPSPTPTIWPTAITDYCWWSEYFQHVYCYPRYTWPGLITNHGLIEKQRR